MKDAMFSVDFFPRGTTLAPVGDGQLEFLPGACVELRETGNGPAQTYSGTFSDAGDCRIAIFTQVNGSPLEKPLILKGLLLREVAVPFFTGGYWWFAPGVPKTYLPPDDVGSWTATSGGNPNDPDA